MSAERDFQLTLDRAAGLLLDAACAARAAARGPIPRSHRLKTQSAIASIVMAQDELYLVRRTPFQTATTVDDQLALL